MKLTRTEEEAANLLNAAASSGRRFYFWQCADHLYGRYSAANFTAGRVVDSMLDDSRHGSMPIEEFYAEAECLIRTKALGRKGA